MQTATTESLVRSGAIRMKSESSAHRLHLARAQLRGPWPDRTGGPTRTLERQEP